MIPRPIHPRRSAIAPRSMSSSSRGLDPQALALADRADRLGLDRPAVDQVATALAVGAAVGAARRMAAALGQQRGGDAAAQRLHFAHHAVAAAMRPGPARAAPDRVLAHPQRELELE